MTHAGVAALSLSGVRSVTEHRNAVWHCSCMNTLMLIMLLAWIPLSLGVAVLVGKSIGLGMDAPDARHRRPQNRSAVKGHPVPTFP